MSISVTVSWQYTRWTIEEGFSHVQQVRYHIIYLYQKIALLQ